jgi:multiple sugar transport system substrate-binding protein/raffinose/stachyose/melibiose transport system substrate-binding protein
MYVYYNKELFEKAGISSPPQSWDEWMEVCQKLKNAGITPIALPGLSANNIGHNVFSGACTGIVSVADPAISTVSNLAYKNYNFDNPLFRKVFQRARDWATSGFVIDGFMSYDYDACVRAFANQEVAMCIEGSWSVANYLNDAEFDFTPLTFIPPYNDRGTPLYGSGCSETGFVIGGTPTVNRELALDIINFMAYEKFAERQQMTGVVPPFAISDIKGEINLHPESARTSNDIASRATMGPLMFTVMLPDVYNRATVLTQEVMMGTTTPDEAVKILNQLQSSYF